MTLDPIWGCFCISAHILYLIVMEINVSEVRENCIALVCKCVPVQQKGDKHQVVVSTTVPSTIVTWKNQGISLGPRILSTVICSSINHIELVFDALNIRINPVGGFLNCARCVFFRFFVATLLPGCCQIEWTPVPDFFFRFSDFQISKKIWHGVPVPRAKINKLLTKLS